LALQLNNAPLSLESKPDSCEARYLIAEYTFRTWEELL